MKRVATSSSTLDIIDYIMARTKRRSLLPSRRLYWDLYYWAEDLHRQRDQMRVPPVEWVRGVAHFMVTLNQTQEAIERSATFRELQYSLMVIRRAFLRGLYQLACSEQGVGHDTLAEDLAAGRLAARALRDDALANLGQFTTCG